MIGIYKITNPKGKIYIGKTKDLKNRIIYYRTLNCKGQPKLYNSILKYSWLNHTLEVIEECYLEQLDNKEIYWIKFYNTVCNGLNCTYGGEGGSKSSETKIKISKSMKGKNDWSVGGYNRKAIFQYTLDGEFIKEWDNASLPQVNNISQCAQGKNKSAGGYIWIYTKDFTPQLLENKVNNCKTNNNLGKSKSLTHIKNISKGKYGVYKKGKTILQYNLKGDFIKEWESIKLSSKTLNIPRSSISSNLNQRYKSAGGYIWKYKK
jgi:group I intron endonuclease